jgi:hypothetical protein
MKERPSDVTEIFLYHILIFENLKTFKMCIKRMKISFQAKKGKKKEFNKES